MTELNVIRESAKAAALELCELAKLTAGQTVIVGCSTSEVAGVSIGKAPNPEIGAVLFEALSEVFAEKGIYLAAQCCEHLNRAVIVERAVSAGFEIVNAVPVPNAGGSFAAAAYLRFKDAVTLEEFRADAGLDIGGTLIGMHLKKVAVPLRLKTKLIGMAAVTAARTRPKLIGGERTAYSVDS